MSKRSKDDETMNEEGQKFPGLDIEIKEAQNKIKRKIMLDRGLSLDSAMDDLS